MFTHEYIETVVPEVVNIAYKKNINTYVVEFKKCIIICSTYNFKNKMTVLIKSITTETGERLTENDGFQYLPYVREIGVVCLDIIKTSFFEWGERYNLIRHMKDIYEAIGLELQVVESMESIKVIQHPIEGVFFAKTAKGDYVKVLDHELKERIEQYKRLKIPASIPEWVLAKVPGKRFEYKPLRDMLGNQDFYLDEKYRKQVLSYVYGKKD